ncbi:response regulator, partial [Spirochaetota bacterium]
MPDIIKVHIVDDSASVRKILGDLIEKDPLIEVIDTSLNPILAEKKLEKRWPDVFILDIEMPGKDGLTFLREIMSTRPTPAIICSSFTETNAKIAMEALSSGAVEVINKPKIGIREFLHESSARIIDAVKAANQANLKLLAPRIKPKPSDGNQKKGPNKPDRIKVHIVDDSASVRKILGDLVGQDSLIEVIDTSVNPLIAEKKLEKMWPDVFILDIEMPGKDGLTFLKEIMAKRPTPVIICSSYTEENAKITMEALATGAVQVINKPKIGI